MSIRLNKKGSQFSINSNNFEQQELLVDEKLLLKDIYTFIEDQNVASASTETEIPLDSHFGDWKIILPCFQQIGCNRYNNHTIANIHEILNQKMKEQPKQEQKSFQPYNLMIYYNDFKQLQGHQQCDNFMNENKIINDSRTTVMIKNLPSNLKIQDLKDELNKNFDRKYDFIYMPFDSQKRYNLGYAFVNFLTPQIVLEFFKKYNSKRWSQFQSEKICTLRYARIQGKRDLISHFQMYY